LSSVKTADGEKRGPIRTVNPRIMIEATQKILHSSKLFVTILLSLFPMQLTNVTRAIMEIATNFGTQSNGPLAIPWTSQT
jgi:hypothetical protein